LRAAASRVEIIKTHIDAIHAVTGSYDHIGIGTDLDGFIKPVLPRLDYPSDMVKLRRGLALHYPANVVEKILKGNALRVLRKVLP
jgi:microsomal dipeptidase-like Zn-dependent dipeptidase